jgi:hypothetical protein
MLRKDLDDLHDNGQLGDWCIWQPEDRPNLYIGLRYPVTAENWVTFYREAPELNRGDVVTLPLVLGASDPTHWGWDGNREAPTLTPSINVIGRWHGWLQAGKLVNA